MARQHRPPGPLDFLPSLPVGRKHAIPVVRDNVETGISGSNVDEDLVPFHAVIRVPPVHGRDGIIARSFDSLADGKLAT